MPCRARLIGSVARRSRLRRVLAPTGRGEREVELAASFVHRRQLQVDHRRRRQCSERDRLAPASFEPVEVERDEEVDGAELLQGPYPPQGQSRGRGDVVRLLERHLRSRRVATPLGPTEHFERLALHLRLLAARGAPCNASLARATATSTSSRAMAACAASALARARRATSGASAAAAWACSSARSHRPAARSADPTSRCTAAWSAGSRRRSSSSAPSAPARSVCPASTLTSNKTSSTSSASEPVASSEHEWRTPPPMPAHPDGARHAACSRNAPARSLTPGATGQLGGQQATIAVEVLLADVEGVQRTAGEELHLGRHRDGEHGIAGQAVPEPEAGCVDVEELHPDAAAELLSRGMVVEVGHPGREPPVERSAQQRRRHEQPATRRRQTVESELDRRQHRPRDPVGDRLPSRVDRGEEQLLDEQRDAFAA